MLVRHRMTPNPVTIDPQAMLSEAQEKMTAGRFRRLPVVESGTLIGILTDRDVRRYVGAEERTKVRAAMTESPLTIPRRCRLRKHGGRAWILVKRRG